MWLHAKRAKNLTRSHTYQLNNMSCAVRVYDVTFEPIELEDKAQVVRSKVC